MMKRLSRLVLPHPYLSLGLFIVWLLMNAPLSMGDVVVGALAGLLVPQMMRPLEPERVRIAKPLTIFVLLWRFFVDVLRSNWEVSRTVMGYRSKTRRSGFVRLPLQLTNRFALAALAIIITGTPGTLWVQYDRYKRVLLLHVLDLDDNQDWPALIHNRYEKLLLEIFP